LAVPPGAVFSAGGNMDALQIKKLREQGYSLFDARRILRKQEIEQHLADAEKSVLSRTAVKHIVSVLRLMNEAQ
jgi:DNA-binding transcriptional MerR regulator